MSWPPVLAELKTRMKGRPDDTRDDAQLAQDLAAAVAFVQRQRPDFRYDLNNPDQMFRPAPPDDLRLGTLMLAVRWRDRARSPDGTIDAGELGFTRVAGFDPDIDRLLRIGRHQKPRVA